MTRSYSDREAREKGEGNSLEVQIFPLFPVPYPLLQLFPTQFRRSSLGNVFEVAPDQSAIGGIAGTL